MRKKNPKPKTQNPEPILCERVISAGFGGQGIMLLGKLLGTSAMKEKKHVTWMPSYGAEVRGGTAHSMVIISSATIPSPIVVRPTTCIVMNKPSLIKFKSRVAKNGLLLINSSLVKNGCARKDITILKVPASEIAAQLGNIKVANMVMLGAYLKKTGIVTLETAIASLKEVFAAKDKRIIMLNERALTSGWEMEYGQNTR
jgi:2-oxoglutarate ferredoxin oxidoreductase subunit gamma